MQMLTSKIQTISCEMGEFTEEKQRSYDDTITLIREFDWKEQRTNLVVSLTNPSITIQDTNGNYLKLATYYNGKFALYYLDNKGKLFTLAIEVLEESFQYIKHFFEAVDSAIFSTQRFKNYFGWWQNQLPHFVTNNFVYTYKRDDFIKYILKTSGINFLMSIILLIMLLLISGSDGFVMIAIIGTVFFILFGGGLNILMLIPYYKYAKKHILIMSKSNDVFYFGSVDAPIQYHKSDIYGFTVIKQRSSKSPFNQFAIVDITIADKVILTIPNSMIDENLLARKLSQFAKMESNELPYL